jgi:hypothetical protein
MSENKQEAQMTDAWSTDETGTPQVQLDTRYGPVSARFVTRGECFIVIGEQRKPAHLNDDRPALQIGSSRYTGSVRLYDIRDDAGPHGWSPELQDSNPLCRWVKGTIESPPVSHRDKMLTAIMAEVRSFVALHPAILHAAEVHALDTEYRRASSRAATLMEQYETALAECAAIWEQLMSATQSRHHQQIAE